MVTQVTKENLFNQSLMVNQSIGTRQWAEPEMIGNVPHEWMNNKIVCCFSCKEAKAIAKKVGFPQSHVEKIERPHGQHEWYITNIMAGCRQYLKWDKSSVTLSIT